MSWLEYSVGKALSILAPFAVAAALEGCFRPLPAGTDTKCLTDDRSEVLIRDLRSTVTTRDPEEVFARDNYFHVPVVPPRSIRLVTDPRICEMASAAYGPRGAGAVSRRVYVVRLGSKGFAVLDPLHFAGEYQTVKIFDASWKLIGGWTGP